MIALYENNQWERKTLRQLKTQFPSVSFRKTSEQDGATWTYDGIDYEAKVVAEAPQPAPQSGKVFALGPIEDFGGKPRQTWIANNAPPPQSSPDLAAAIQALIAGDTVAAQAAMDRKK